MLTVSGSFRADSRSLQRYELKVGDFSQLSVVDGINVEYRCSEDSAGLAVFETTKAIADQLIFDTSKEGRLSIEKQFHNEGQLVFGLPVVKVYSRFLTQAKNSGDSTLYVASVAPCPEFKAVTIGNGRVVIHNISCAKFDGAIKTGNGQLVVNGKCDSAVLSNTGVGSIQADGLEAGTVSCRFFGTGTTGIWVTDTLIIKGMFPGKLYYHGKPKKIKNYSMGGKIYPMDDWMKEKQTEKPAAEAPAEVTEHPEADSADRETVSHGAEDPAQDNVEP